MADIKQAAKWMSEGKRVTNPRLDESISLGIIQGSRSRNEDVPIAVFTDRFQAIDKRLAFFDPKDLLAEDWEVAS